MARARVPERQFQALEAYLTRTGYWQGERRQTHAFVLSPDLPVLTSAEQNELDIIADGIRRLLGATERALLLAGDPARSSRSWQLFRKFLSAGAPGAFAEAQMRAERLDGRGVLTPAVKADLIRSSQGFHLVEIDGWNPRALGFTVLLRGLADEIRHGLQTAGFDCDALHASFYPGVVPALLTYLRQHGFQSLLLIVSQLEGFYAPAYEALAAGLTAGGISTDLVFEDALHVDRELCRFTDDSERALFAIPTMPRTNRDRLFLTHPLAVSRTIFPPKPVWSSKGLLALVSQAPVWAQEVLAEAGYTDAERRDLARYIPRTRFPSLEDRLPVIKRVHSSGSHGVAFPDELADPYLTAYAEATRGGVVLDRILQERIRARCSTFRSFQPDGNLHKAADYRERYVIHVAGPDWLVGTYGPVLDVDVTARQDENVHGQPDCLQFLALRELI